MPRSGSTLLQNIPAQNPCFLATPTSGLLELIFGARLNYGEVIHKSRGCGIRFVCSLLLDTILRDSEHSHTNGHY